MNCPKDKVSKALAHKEQRPVPAQVLFESATMRAEVLKHYGAANLKDMGLQFMMFGYPDEPKEDLGNGTYRDFYGCVWKQSGSIPHLEEVPLKKPDLKQYTFPDFSRKELYLPLISGFESESDEFSVVNAYCYGLLERAWMLCGFEDFFVYLLNEERFVRELVGNLHRNALQSLEYLLKIDGIDAINLGPGDSGAQKGLLMAPDTWRKYFKKPYQEEIELVKKAGKVAYTHSCGDNTAIMDDYIDVGLDILHPIQPEAMDVKTIKKKYGKRITFHGGLGTQTTLTFGTPADVRRETKETLKILGEGGGYIAEPAKPVPYNVPMENVFALIDSLLEQE